MAKDADVIAVDHTGFSVASLEEAIQFWTEEMGFDLARRGEMGGEFLREATGVNDPRCRMSGLEGRSPKRAERPFVFKCVSTVAIWPLLACQAAQRRFFGTRCRWDFFGDRPGIIIKQRREDDWMPVRKTSHKFQGAAHGSDITAQSGQK